VVTDELRCGERNAVRPESFRDSVKANEGVQVGNRQWCERRYVQQLEERQIEGNSSRQDTNGRDGESRRAPKSPGCVAQILLGMVDPRCNPHRPSIFPDSHNVAERAARGILSLVGRHAVCHALLGFQFEVRPNLSV
jgi:hypothetical protein